MTTANASVTQEGQANPVALPDPADLENLSSHRLALIFADNATPSNVRTQQWQFTTGRIIQVTGQWDFDQGDLSATIGRISSMATRRAKPR